GGRRRPGGHPGRPDRPGPRLAALAGVCRPAPAYRLPLPARPHPEPAGATMSPTTRPTPTPIPTPTHVLLDRPLGQLRLVGDGRHLTGVYFEQHRHAPADLGPTVDLDDADPVLQAAARQVSDYLAGRRTEFDLPVRAPGTPFQQRVW